MSMHQPVKDSLEDYLRGTDGRFLRPLPAEVEDHLEACGECKSELKDLERQAVALRSLRAPAGFEPRGGFYARVMQRIDEARASSSVWSAFLEPLFAKRLAVVSATLVVLIGTYLFTTERADAALQPSVASVAQSVNVDNTTQQERDAVLAQLVDFAQ